MIKRAGFTLLEVLLAITILATLMAFTTQSVLRSSRDKVKLQGEIDRDSRLTNALRTMERDINMAFHHRQIITEVEKEVKKSNQQQAQTGNTTGATTAGATGTTTGATGVTQPGQQPGNPQGNQAFDDFEVHEYPQLTQFMGTEKSVHFTSLSHVRTQKDSPESDQQEVGYYLDSCDAKNEGDPGQCLWRRASAYIDENVDKGGGSVLLLSGVKDLKFRYYGEEKLDWVSAWRTDQGGDEATKDIFPLAVEVTLSVIEKGKESSVSTVVPIMFPNNINKKQQGAQLPGGVPQGQTGQGGTGQGTTT
jgi:prepilin-type N-terminal cleavage/methylation domain-containing protein